MQPLTQHWYDSPYTGLFCRFGGIAPRACDPDIAVSSGTLPAWGARRLELSIGGVGWDKRQAELACVGEGLERMQPYPLPCDQSLSACYERWPLDEPAVEPGRWILFHAQQYQQPGFPFAPFTSATVCRWVCFRDAQSGTPWWVPEELAFLYPREGVTHGIGPGVSTGLSSGGRDYPALLRGLQEVIERDTVVGAWWERYVLEEWEAAKVLGRLDPSVSFRILRRNLTYRFYRVGTPYSAHVVIVTVEGEDQDGFCFSVGSACRETREAAWLKALLEAIHGRHYVRYLLQSKTERERAGATDEPADFSEHAVYYSLHPDRLARTVLKRSGHSHSDKQENVYESVAALRERLGPDRPILFRNLTPPGIAAELSDYHVLKVIVPGLQPLHGNHRLPHLGGPLWSPRGLADWSTVPPHPFP